MNEDNWIHTNPSKRGMFDGRSAESIEAEKNRLKARHDSMTAKGHAIPQAEVTKMHELEFALRAKRGHGFSEELDLDLVSKLKEALDVHMAAILESEKQKKARAYLKAINQPEGTAGDDCLDEEMEPGNGTNWMGFEGNDKDTGCDCDDCSGKVENDLIDSAMPSDETVSGDPKATNANQRNISIERGDLDEALIRDLRKQPNWVIQKRKREAKKGKSAKSAKKNG